MARRPRILPAVRPPARVGGSFSWPERSRSAAAERAADLAAERALERLRARRRTPPPARRLAAPLAQAPPLDHPPAPPPRRPTQADEDGSKEARADRSEPAVSNPSPAPDPWGPELDDLTEELVVELRRDLGPAGGERQGEAG